MIRGVTKEKGKIFYIVEGYDGNLMKFSREELQELMEVYEEFYGVIGRKRNDFKTYLYYLITGLFLGALGTLATIIAIAHLL